ncbi:MAG TPA: hypothetical protein VG738_12515 [Chitinophagaceae bacterium]|nr:hypothetical protein [Chitinophagaceae bacterium]
MAIRTSIIETMEAKAFEDYRRNYYSNLLIEKNITEHYFSWLKLTIHTGMLKGGGVLHTPSNRYDIEISYSPFFEYRFDRIYINGAGIAYNNKIHVYRDLSLCLYHPVQDKPVGKIIHLTKMVPWISEWCIHFEEWKKYGVWLGREITH